MKEFEASTGGRNVYVEDIQNLQDLALAFSSIFDGCDNFAISGCSVTDSAISAGYVYINGKIRKFAGASNITAWPQYIYELNTVETVAYNNGTTQKGRTIYGSSISSSSTNASDSVTGLAPQYITVKSTGAKTIKEALFGRYAALISPTEGSQIIDGDVSFLKNVTLNGLLSAAGGVSFVNGTSAGKIYYDGTSLVAQSKVASGDIYKITILQNGFSFSVNSNAIVTINGTSMSVNGLISSTTSKSGSIQTTTNYVHNYSDASDNGTVYINMLGYNGGSTYYRNTVIGNGKGSALISVKGSDATVTMNGQLIVNGNSAYAIIVNGGKSIQFKDSAGNSIGYMGYDLSGDDKSFRLVDNTSDINITGLTSVNIGPAIKEGGVLLSNKYVLKTDYDTKISTLALSSSVYSKTDSDTTFGKLNGGLKQFVVGSNTAAVLRTDIGAASIDDITTLFPTKKNLLSDMVSTEDEKKTLCSNIGAVYNAEYQKKLYDSGWKNATGIGINSSEDWVKVRQYGNIVQIIGHIHPVKQNYNPVLFTLPNGIDPAANYTLVCHHSDNVAFDRMGNWHAYILNNECKGYGYTDAGEGVGINISCTYIVG